MPTPSAPRVREILSFLESADSLDPRTVDLNFKQIKDIYFKSHAVERLPRLHLRLRARIYTIRYGTEY